MEFMTMVCDIKDSRLLQNREDIQKRLIEALKEVNSRFPSCIAKEFIITMGDEWQGLLHPNSDYSSILNFFHEKLGEVDFYCGIGIGEVSIHDFELTVNQLDGPSFYKARKAVRLAKRLKCSLVLIY